MGVFYIDHASILHGYVDIKPLAADILGYLYLCKPSSSFFGQISQISLPWQSRSGVVNFDMIYLLNPQTSLRIFEIFCAHAEL